MSGPLVVNVHRGDRVESRHEVDAVVVDEAGSIIESWGDAGRAVMPRSTAKPLQAVPLLASGAAGEFGVDEVELALACASHNGEPGHVERVVAWLDRLSLGPDDLECGPQYPVYEPAFVDLVASGGEAGPEHNNCSGKHAGFLTVCRRLDLPTAGYIQPEHPLQRDHVTPAMEELCCFDAEAQNPLIDGCGIPVWEIPLSDLSRGWSRLADSAEGSILLNAMIAEPWFVAGSDRSSTRFMTDALQPVAAKAGAEGVFCAVLVDTRTAIALKARDGAGRAADAAMEHVLAVLGAVTAIDHPVHNRAGTVVGSIEVSA